MSNHVQTLNKISSGWVEGDQMICNPNAGGGIIDVAIVSGEWFFVCDFGDKVYEGYETREDAVEAFCNMSVAHRGMGAAF